MLRRTPLKAKKGLTTKKGLTRKTPLKSSGFKKKATSPLRRSSLKQSTKGLKTTKPLKAKTTIKENPKRRTEAKRFHDEVFALYGSQCCFCLSPEPATDAAHVISRAKLGKHRYARPELARPAHRRCHQRQTDGKINFSLKIRQEATKIHNLLCRSEIELPT